MEQSDALGYQPPLDPALVQQHVSLEAASAGAGGEAGKVGRSGVGRGVRQRSRKPDQRGRGPQQDLRQAEGEAKAGHAPGKS